jgi:hypothetical protein
MAFLTSLLKLLGGEHVNDGIGRQRLPRDWWKVDGFVPLATGGVIEVVGESHYQESFEKTVGDRWAGGVYWHTVAQLFFVDDNEHDANAIGVMVDGRPVGHIPASEAPALRSEILAINPDRLPVFCKGEIIGGFVKGKKRGSYGLTLDVARPLRRKTR